MDKGKRVDLERSGRSGQDRIRSEKIREDQRMESVGEHLSLLPGCFEQWTISSHKSLPVIRRGGSVGGIGRRRFCGGVVDMTTSRHP